MNYNQFSNLSCYEEFEIQCDLLGISKLDILKEIGYQIDDYYFFVSNDGFFNWFDLEGNHIDNPGVLKEIKEEYIPKNITKCIIPDSVTTIGNNAFAFCKSLKEITIPNSVINIGNNAFDDCESLKEITIPNNVTSIGDGAFFYCESLKEIIIPDSVTIIGSDAFYRCISLTSITISNNITSIDDFVFRYCTSLTSITIHNNVSSIGYGAFSYCNSLKEIIFKGKMLDEVKQMKNYPFGIKNESIIKCEI